jgi:hypothetical protein
LESRLPEFGSPEVSFFPPIPFPLSPPPPLLLPPRGLPDRVRPAPCPHRRLGPRPGALSSPSPAPRPASPDGRAVPRRPRALFCPGEPCPGKPSPDRAPRRAPPRPRPSRALVRAPSRPCPNPCLGSLAPLHALARTRASVASRHRAPLPEPVRRQPRATRACTIRVPSAHVACSRAYDHNRTALNLVLIYFNLFSRCVASRAASRALSRDDPF